MSCRDVAAPLERLKAIGKSVRQVLGEKRWWLTREEFLANVEAHRRKRDQEQINPKSVNHKPAEVRDYQLKRYVGCNRQMEFKCREVVA